MDTASVPHSPVALRELSGKQLFVTRGSVEKHDIRAVGIADDIQSTIRLYPDTFLARRVIICEGASEVGLIRGVDQYRITNDQTSIAAHGIALVDCGGGDADRPFKCAAAFHALGYRAAVIWDDDKKPTAAVEEAFIAGGGGGRRLARWSGARGRTVSEFDGWRG